MQPDHDALIALAERCEKATGADRMIEIDVDLIARETSLARAATAPAYTASVDAALALAAEVLPGWQVILGQHCPPGKAGERWRGTLTQIDAHGIIASWAATPALALLAATLRAKAASTQGRGG